LYDDIEKPEFLASLLKPKGLYFKALKDTFRPPYENKYEKYLCSILGESHYKLVPPIYKQNLFHGRVESYGPGEIPFNLFNKNLVKSYPITRYARIMHVDLK
jgi:hypothetical protein